jgi:hypothetical protein
LGLSSTSHLSNYHVTLSAHYVTMFVLGQA